MAVFLDVVPCSIVEIYRRFRGAYSIHDQGDDRPNDGGSKYLSTFMRQNSDTSQKLPSSYSPQ
jgi:hypothetical protein